MEFRSMTTSVHMLVSIVMLTSIFTGKGFGDNEVSMDVGDNGGDCSQVIPLGPGNETTIRSNGRAPNGFCGMTFYPVSDESNHCYTMCVTRRTFKTKTCDMKFKVTAVHFDKSKEDEILEYDCYHRTGGPWCRKTNMLRVEVVEKPKYTQKTARQYSFLFDVSPQCDDLFPGSHSAANSEASEYMKSKENRSYQNKMEGILVACLLSSIFLVTLVVMWCYYKNKAISGPPSDPCVRKPANV